MAKGIEFSEWKDNSRFAHIEDEGRLFIEIDLDGKEEVISKGSGNKMAAKCYVKFNHKGVAMHGNLNLNLTKTKAQLQAEVQAERARVADLTEKLAALQNDG